MTKKRGQPPTSLDVEITGTDGTLHRGHYYIEGDVIRVTALHGGTKSSSLGALGRTDPAALAGLLLRELMH
jgi:hypothetical protein